MAREEKQRKGLQSRQSMEVLRGQAILVLPSVFPAGLDWSGRGDAEVAARDMFFCGSSRQLLTALGGNTGAAFCQKDSLTGGQAACSISGQASPASAAQTRLRKIVRGGLISPAELSEVCSTRQETPGVIQSQGKGGNMLLGSRPSASDKGSEGSDGSSCRQGRAGQQHEVRDSHLSGHSLLFCPSCVSFDCREGMTKSTRTSFVPTSSTSAVQDVFTD